MFKKLIYKYVLHDLSKIKLLTGVYDAKNGNESYMNGVSLVMEVIAYRAGDDKFGDMFLNNLIESERKAGIDGQQRKIF